MWQPDYRLSFKVVGHSAHDFLVLLHRWKPVPPRTDWKPVPPRTKCLFSKEQPVHPTITRGFRSAATGARWIRV